jgi:hypothetical protein
VTSIWQWDDEVYVNTEMLASYKGKYDVRLVGRAISEIEEGGICACEINEIAVDGETGWQADLLAIAWWRDGEWDCTASPLTSILLILTDDQGRNMVMPGNRRTPIDQEMSAVNRQAYTQ